MGNFEVVEHTADWSLRIWGQDLESLLRHAAEGMNGLMVVDVTAVPRTTWRTLTLDAYDSESLLVEWLGELAYWAEMEGLIFPEFTLTDITPTHLQATLHGGPALELVKHIKAVTYHNLEIISKENGLEVTIVFDV
jgi:SHS2 domain-containing protein